MLLGLLYRIIGDFFSYIGDIGDTTTPGIDIRHCHLDMKTKVVQHVQSE